MYQNFNKVYLINKFSRLQITSHVFILFLLQKKDYRLIFFLFLSGSAISLAEVLPLYATRAATTEWRLEREVDVFLRVQSYNERWDVHYLLTNAEIKHTKNKNTDHWEIICNIHIFVIPKNCTN